MGRLLQSANRVLPLADFLDDATRLLLLASRGSAAVIRLEEWVPRVRHRAIQSHRGPFRFQTESASAAAPGPGSTEALQMAICRALMVGNAVGPPSNLTRRGAYHASDATSAPPVVVPGETAISVADWARSGGFRSLVLIPVRVDGRAVGLLQLVDARPERFAAGDIAFLEDAAEALGLALVHHRAQWALQERVKELTCLYGIARVARDLAPGGRRDVFERIVRLLPHGWQYPGDCAARITLDGEGHATEMFSETPWMQSAPIVVEGKARGRVEIAYLASKPEMQEGPFLAEERSLIDEIARQVGLIIEAQDAEEERARLTQQLLHADRLATIGKLTAGVAHELNEPLGAILGFAQLSLDSAGLPPGARRDSERIVQSALHAREIIRKLMFFGRQTPPGRAEVDLNLVVQDGLDLLEPRLVRQGIRASIALNSALPLILADRSQLLQVVVNLVINAIQAMPDGGSLTVRTDPADMGAALSVEDTGVGMSEDVRSQVFLPFFTTKDVGEGTGLGLSVAHGIVTAHGGTIDVASEPGRGSVFIVRLPAASTKGGDPL